MSPHRTWPSRGAVSHPRCHIRRGPPPRARGDALLAAAPSGFVAYHGLNRDVVPALPLSPESSRYVVPNELSP